jgi:hypothetical protein
MPQNPKHKRQKLFSTRIRVSFSRGLAIAAILHADSERAIALSLSSRDGALPDKLRLQF